MSALLESKTLNKEILSRGNVADIKFVHESRINVSTESDKNIVEKNFSVDYSSQPRSLACGISGTISFVKFSSNKKCFYSETTNSIAYAVMTTTDSKNTILHVDVATKQLSEFQTDSCESNDDDDELKIEFSSNDIDVMEKNIELCDKRELSQATTSALPICTRLRKSSRNHKDIFSNRTDTLSFDWLDDVEVESDDEILKTPVFPASNVKKKHNTSDENFTGESNSTCEKSAVEANDSTLCRETENLKLPLNNIESDDYKQDVCHKQPIEFPNKEPSCSTANILEKKKHSQSKNDKADNSTMHDGEDYSGLKLILKRCWLQRYKDEKINDSEQVNFIHKKQANVAKILPESRNTTNSMKDSCLQKNVHDDRDQTLTESNTKKKHVNEDVVLEKDKVANQMTLKKSKTKSGSKKSSKTSKDKRTTKSQNEKKASEQHSSKQSDVASESMETEARITMEFPRHNWLARHLLTEKHLQSDQLDVSNCAKGASEKGSFTVASSAASSVSYAPSKTVASSQLGNDTNDTTTASSLPHQPLLAKASNSESKDSENSQHISVVVPVQYYTKNSIKQKTMNDCKENFAETKKEPFDQDAILQTVKNISLKTSKSSCSEKLANVVNFERPLSYIVAPASRDNEALDLTTKPKDSKTPFALDLSKKLVKDASNKTNKKKDAKPQNKDQTAFNGLNNEEHRSSSLVIHTESQVKTFPNQKPFIVISSRSETSTSTRKTQETIVKNATPPSTAEKLNKNRYKLLTNSHPSHLQNGFPCPESSLKQNLLFESCQKSQTNRVSHNLKISKSKITPLPTSAMKPQGLNRKRPLSSEAASPSACISKSLRITKTSTRSLDELLPIIDVDALKDDIPEIKPRFTVPTSSNSKSKFFSTASTNSNSILMTNTRRKSLPESYNCANVKPTSKLVEAKPFLPSNNPLMAEQEVSKTMLWSKKDFNTAPSSSSEVMINLSHKKDHQASSRLSLSLPKKHSDFDIHLKDVRAQHPPPKSLTLEFKKQNVRHNIQSGVTAPAGAVDSLRSSLPQNQFVKSSPMTRYCNSDYMPLRMPSISMATNASNILSHSNYQLATSLAQARTLFPFKPTALRNPAIRSNPLTHAVHQRYASPRFSRTLMGPHRLPPPSQQFFFKQNHNRSLPQHSRTHVYNENSNLSNSTAIMANLERSVISDKISSVKSFITPRSSIDGLSYAAAKFSSSSDLGPLSAQEAGKLAADLQQQKFELEKQILNLRTLEKKFQSPTSYNTNHINLSRLTTEERFYNQTISLPGEQRSKGENPKTNNFVLDKSVVPSRPCSFQMISTNERPLPMHELGMLNKNEQTFSMRNVEICVHCRKKAFFVCSGCRLVWYCSKQCQLDHWPCHSKQCA